MTQICYAENCTNPAIGNSLQEQKVFVKFLFNRLYQAEFCGTCHDKYTKLAEDMSPSGLESLLILPSVWLFPISFFMIFTSMLTEQAIHIISGVILLFCWIGISYMLNKKEKQRIATITRENPSFDKFYKIWKQRRT